MIGIIPEFAIIIFAFFFIGVFVVVLLILELFFSRSSGNLRSTEYPNAGSTAFLQALSHVSDIYRGKGGGVTVFENGNRFLKAFLSDVEDAKKSVNITVYVWEAGDTTEMIVKKLSEKAWEGVPVRLLIDGIGGFGNVRHQFQVMTNAGVDVRYFRGIRPDKLIHLHRRTHRRAIVIDGKVGYTGGMAFADYWYQDTWRGSPWEDLMFRVTGAPVGALQASFSELWANTSGEILSGTSYYPEVGDEEAVEDEGQEERKETGSYPRHNGEDRPFLHLSSSPSSDVHPFSKFLWYSGACAKDRLYAVSPYFAPNKSFHNLLKDRAKAGVDVRLVLPNEEHIDRRFVKWAANSYYWDLLDAGVRIYEYAPSMIHTKLMVVDGVWSVFGSGNIDFRSFELNEENTFGIQDGILAHHLDEVFDRYLEHSKEITLPEWKKRGVWARFRERIVLLFAEQF